MVFIPFKTLFCRELFITLPDNSHGLQLNDRSCYFIRHRHLLTFLLGYYFFLSFIPVPLFFKYKGIFNKAEKGT